MPPIPPPLTLGSPLAVPVATDADGHLFTVEASVETQREPSPPSSARPRMGRCVSERLMIRKLSVLIWEGEV